VQKAQDPKPDAVPVPVVRVLYIEDEPRWEYRYLKNGLLRASPSVELQAYLFDATLDFPQESSPNLPSLKGLPRTREALFRYDVILIGDVPPERLGFNEAKQREWLDLLVEFVEAGGGAGFMFGPRAMPESYRKTPLENLLPAVLHREASKMQPEAREGFRPQLANPEHPHEIVRIHYYPDGNAFLWREGLEPVMAHYPVLKAKDEAEILLVHPKERNNHGPRVIAAAARYGRGRTFFIATDETWRWRRPYGEKYQDRFWINVVRHLANGEK
jgi:uncharacterized membrane protein